MQACELYHELWKHCTALDAVFDRIVVLWTSTATIDVTGAASNLMPRNDY